MEHGAHFLILYYPPSGGAQPTCRDTPPGHPRRYHDDYMPPGAEAAYQVKLDAGCAGCDAASCDDLIYAPADHDRFIRKAND